MDDTNVEAHSNSSPECSLQLPSISDACTVSEIETSTVVSDVLQQPTSSIYSQSVSVLQSPPHHQRECDPTRLSVIAPSQFQAGVSPTLVSPPRMQSNIKLTALQPVTPSRINATPHDLCGGKNITSPDQHVRPTGTLSSPPVPFRMCSHNDIKLRPIITKKGRGKISVAYPQDFLTNQLKASDYSNTSLSMLSERLTQFLSQSKVPTTISCAEAIKKKDLFTPSVSTRGESGTSETIPNSGKSFRPRNISNQEVPMTNKEAGGKIVRVVDEDDDDEEDRQSMANITQALNINVDMYEEMKKRRKSREFSSKLPKEVQGLMGEANICYARGDYNSALQMCMEIIRTGPWCPDPYELLAVLYEERGDSVKHLQYSLLAAYLQVGDVSNWLTLARNCEEAGFLGQAAHCYSKALKLKPDDYQVLWAAAVVQQQLGNIHRALTLFKSVVKAIPSGEAGERMTLARDIARACHANKETVLALEVMDEVASEYPDDVKYEDVNVMCELAMFSKQYIKVFQIIAKHCQADVRCESKEATEAVIKPTYVKVSPDLPMDLKCKCVLAAIPLDCLEVVHHLYEEICGLTSSDYGDLQLDLADLFIEVKEYKKALYVLDILLKSKEYSLAAVWMKKGECHQHLSDPYEEMKCFKRVVEEAPGYAKAYLVLCKVLRKLQKYKEAVEVIQEAETYELGDEEQMLLNYETFIMYKEWADLSKKRHDKFCKAADLGLLMLANRLEATLVYTKTILLRRDKTRDGIYKGDVRVTRKVGKYGFKHQNKKSLVAKGLPDIISPDEWWDLFLDTCDMLHKSERFVDGVTILETALSHGVWIVRPERKIKMEQMTCAMCMLGGNFYRAYTYLRLWILARPSSPALWNIFNQITLRSEDQRHHRFCLRALVKFPDSIALAVLTGHNSLATGTYKHSLSEYIRAHRQLPNEPMYAMLLGVIYTHIASQKFTTHKNTLVMQSIAFLNLYMKKRGCNQEAYYNIGRMYHQIGLNQYAVQWYKKALATSPPQCDISPEVIDLKAEVGYNLATLYRKSGNTALAMKVLREYCVV